MKKLLSFFAIALIGIGGLSPLKAQQHDYYTGLSQGEAEKAELRARGLARFPNYFPEARSDRQRVYEIVSLMRYHQKIFGIHYGIHQPDPQGYSRTPYGVLITNSYNSEGTTLALGRILEIMGFRWIHENQNSELHQWNKVVLDGRLAWADAMSGQVEYGNRCDTDPSTWTMVPFREGLTSRTCPQLEGE